jgi:hypothetical protein
MQGFDLKTLRLVLSGALLGIATANAFFGVQTTGELVAGGIHARLDVGAECQQVIGSRLGGIGVDALCSNTLAHTSSRADCQCRLFEYFPVSAFSRTNMPDHPGGSQLIQMIFGAIST